MAVLPVRIWPDPVLTQRAPEVGKVDDDLRRLIDDMFATMYDEDGIGLAANQVGVAARLVVLDLDPRKRATAEPEVARELEAMGWRGPFAAINPQVRDGRGSLDWEEGCLSVPGITDWVKRQAQVTLSYLDRDGQAQQVVASGLFAVAIQHEIDHLDGRVFIDRLSRLKREVYRKRLRNLARQTPPERAARARQGREEVPHEL